MVVVDLITRHKNALSETSRSQHFSSLPPDLARRPRNSVSMPNIAKVIQLEERAPTPMAVTIGSETTYAALGTINVSEPASFSSVDIPSQPSPGSSQLGTPSDTSETLSVEQHSGARPRGGSMAVDSQLSASMASSASSGHLSASHTHPGLKSSLLPQIPIVPYELHTPPRIPRDDVKDSRFLMLLIFSLILRCLSCAHP